MRYPTWLAAGLLSCLAAAGNAVPVLQLYVEGATYDDEHESWVFPAGTDPFRLWVIGNVAGPGGHGAISDVELAITYADELAGQDLTLSLTAAQIGGAGEFGGFHDPSVATPATFTGFDDTGAAPTLFGGRSLPAHGVYGPGWEWQAFSIGDMTLTDSEIADFIDTFPDAPSTASGQINAYDVSVDFPAGRGSFDLHIDAYGRLGSRAVFAPFSHDAGTGINSPVPAPAPLLLFGVALLGLGARLRRR